MAASGTRARSRVGDEVLRPTNPNTPAIQTLLRHAHTRGFHGVPQPIAIGPDGRERLGFIPGDVPYPPFPKWAQSERALTSAVELLRRYHDAVADFVPPPDARWSDELADPAGGTLICHHDVCPENVVYRGGIAVALLDFDFAAPGRALYDLAQLARMCVPLDTADDAAREGRRSLDTLAPFVRLRAVADAYGLPPDRSAFVDVITETMTRGSTFVRRRVERGEPAFIEMWNAMGGQARSPQSMPTTTLSLHLIWFSSATRWSTVADMRCTMEARPSGQQPVAVTHHADTLDEACRGAAQKLRKLLGSRFGRLHDRKGGDTLRQAETR